MVRGYTLIELIIVVMLIGIVAAISVPNLIDLRTDARSAVTKDEMAALKRAIVGDGRVVAGGSYAFPGYEADIGAPPGALNSLASLPDGVSAYDPLVRSGWRGPYVDTDTVSDYSKDAWGTAYYFTTSPRVIRSYGPNRTDNSGGSDDISLTY